MRMQNKNQVVRTNRQNHSSNYRSIKYKINPENSAINYKSNGQVDQIHPHKSTIFNLKRKWNHFSVVKQNKYKKYHTVQAQQERDQCHHPAKITYLQTWNSLLKRTQTKIETSRLATIDRVYLPHLNEQGTSNFTVLDPLNLPIQYIKFQINKITLGLIEPIRQIRQLRTAIVQFRQCMQRNLQQLQKNIRLGCIDLKKMLASDQIQEQQRRFRHKRLCIELKEQYQSFKVDFHQTKTKLTSLQEVIFKGQPFELQSKIQLKQQFPQLYF